MFSTYAIVDPILALKRHMHLREVLFGKVEQSASGHA